MKLPHPKQGKPVQVSGRTVPFSLWPVTKGHGGYRLNPPLFASSPWPVMRQSVNQISRSESRTAAIAFLEQAEDFFSASGRANAAAAKPLLLYYSFLNLAKALILVRSNGEVLDKATHGLSERLKPGGRELADAYLARCKRSSPRVFELLLTTLCGTKFNPDLPLDVPLLLRQVVTGHRLLATCDKSCGERFLALKDFDLLHNSTSSEIWLRFSLPKNDLTRIDITQTRLLKESRLAQSWRAVASPDGTNHKAWFESTNSITYKATWIADSVPAVLDTIGHELWQTALSVPPYRSYYLFCAPPSEHPQVLPQLLSAYALMFYFGSITRYRPHQFDRILAGEFGAFVATFLHEQPMQMLFLFASEFMRRDVARPALV